METRTNIQPGCPIRMTSANHSPCPSSSIQSRSLIKSSNISPSKQSGHDTRKGAFQHNSQLNFLLKMKICMIKYSYIKILQFITTLTMRVYPWRLRWCSCPNNKLYREYLRPVTYCIREYLRPVTKADYSKVKRVRKHKWCWKIK